MPDGDAALRREQMVQQHLVARGIDDERVLEAMRAVPREAFVPEEHQGLAYADQPLPIGHGQTISQPYIVALLAQALDLQGHERVLEVGTGSGYSTALLGRLAREVVSVERHAELAGRARDTLAQLGAGNIEVITGDGSRGWPDRAPYDAIAVHALAPDDPQAFLAQLAPAGRLVVPLPAQSGDLLTLFISREGRVEHQVLDMVAFVPLINDEKPGPVRLAPGQG